MLKSKKLSIDELKNKISVDFSTGIIYRIDPGYNKPQFVGVPCGNMRGPLYKTGKGYLSFIIDKKYYYNHHVVFALAHGYWPKMIDHINGDTQDNRLANIRECTPGQNARNLFVHRNGHPPGIRVAPSGKFEVRVMHNKVRKSLGNFKTLEEAIYVHRNYLEKLNVG